MAKAFVFADLHGSYKHLKNLERFILENKNIKVLIFAGDLVNMGEPVSFVDNFLESMLKINLPLVWVPGNNDFGRSYYKLNANIRSVEGRVAEINGRKYTGVGGSPESWEGQYAGENLEHKIEIAGTIFVSHVPPPGVLIMQKKDCNSPTSKKKFADSPLVHICGHVHSRWGCGWLGTTKVINPGPLMYGYYAIMDLDSFEIEFHNFMDGESKLIKE